jgi:hypothetical protein
MMKQISTVMGIWDPAIDALLISLLPSISDIYHPEKIVDREKWLYLMAAILHQDQKSEWSEYTYQWLWYILSPWTTAKMIKNKVASWLAKK